MPDIPGDLMMSWDTLDPDTLTQEKYGKVMAEALDSQISVAGNAITHFEFPEREHAALSAYIYTNANAGKSWDEIYYVSQWRGFPIKRMTE